jgi:hypothetical protein
MIDPGSVHDRRGVWRGSMVIVVAMHGSPSMGQPSIPTSIMHAALPGVHRRA